MSPLKRAQQAMPGDIEMVLRAHEVLDAYEERPAYQRNDYLAWIGRARQPETRARRLGQMLDELREGGVYMGMTHAPSRRGRR